MYYVLNDDPINKMFVELISGVRKFQFQFFHAHILELNDAFGMVLNLCLYVIHSLTRIFWTRQFKMRQSLELMNN